MAEESRSASKLMGPAHEDDSDQDDSISSIEEFIVPLNVQLSGDEGSADDAAAASPPASKSKVLERAGSLRNLTKQLSLPRQMGAIPLSPAPKRKSARRMSLGSSTSVPRQTRSNSPGPLLGGSLHRRRTGGQSQSPTREELNDTRSPVRLHLVDKADTKGRSPGNLARTRSGDGPMRTRSGEGLRGGLSRARSDSMASLGSKSRSFRAQRKLGLAKKASSKRLVGVNGIVGILRCGKFSEKKQQQEEQEETSKSKDDEEGSLDRSRSNRRRDRPTERITRVSFWFPDEASVAGSFCLSEDGSMQLMDLFMDGDDDYDHEDSDQGRSFRESVPFIDMMGDGEGYGELGTFDLNDLSGRDLMIEQFHNSTIQEELGASFGDGLQQSFGSMLSDEDLGSIIEGDRESSPSGDEPQKKFLRAATPPPAPALNGSITSLLSDESPMKKKSSVNDDITPNIANLRKTRGMGSRSPPPPEGSIPQHSVSSLLSDDSESLPVKTTDGEKDPEAAVDLSTLKDELPSQKAVRKEGSASSDTSNESPLGVADLKVD